MSSSAKWAILINPPVYDTQYWARWSMPHGLLKVATWLKQNGYETVLFDCLNPYGVDTGAGESPPEEGYDTVRKTKRWIVRCGASGHDPEWIRDITDMPKNYVLRPDEKYRFVFGLPPEELQKRLAIFKKQREADGDIRPVEIWVTSIMTYWWESTKHVIDVALSVFPGARVRVGGIYPTLAWSHAHDNLGLATPLVIDGDDLRLFDEKLMQHDLIVRKEISAASWLPLDLGLYSDAERPPYTILTTSRGCSHTCSYCAAHLLNNSGRKVVHAPVEIVLAEIRAKLTRYSIRHYCFYEDNLLMNIHQFKELLKAIMADNSLRDVKLYAPEGIEIGIALHDKSVWLLKRGDKTMGVFWPDDPEERPTGERSEPGHRSSGKEYGPCFIQYQDLTKGVLPKDEAPGRLELKIGRDTLLIWEQDQTLLLSADEAGPNQRTANQYSLVPVPEVVYLMWRAGFEKIYLPLETVKARTNQRWNRAWNKMPQFESLLKALQDVGYSARQQEINAFVMFGLPGEDIEEVMDTALFASARVGSVIPMLFTPVPSTPAFEQYKAFINAEGYDLHQLNGKLFPFFAYLKEANDSRGRRPLRVEDYLRLESFMQRLNAKIMGRSFDILDSTSKVATVFQNVYSEWRPALWTSSCSSDGEAVPEEDDESTRLEEERSPN